MEALVLTGTKKLEVKDIDRPKVLPNEVLIHTAFAGICGTDHALYAGLPGSELMLFLQSFLVMRIQVLLQKSVLLLLTLKLVTA
ncbi:hypothetical protein LME02_01140 [Leuconostoc mesenteroides subsp. dextranicum]|nr:hypothetical protein LME02_01140 [Leuconostoc mesenteroides subsp. dextranicum]